MKRLLLCGAAVLSVIGLVFVLKADDVKYDKYGRPYTRDRGIVGGTWHAVTGGLFGHRQYENAPSREYCDKYPEDAECKRFYGSRR
jgi:hypothetical protein